MDERDEALITHTAEIVAAHVANNSVAIVDITRLIVSVHDALAYLGARGADGDEVSAAAQKPAVTIRASVKPDRLTCLEDGKSMKLLKRHLRIAHDMTPDQYRAKWKLPRDYPIVAPDYREMRSALAKSIGLGCKSGQSRPRRTLNVKT